MMSIGSNLRLEHLEEQPLRSKKPAANSGSAAKPPKFNQKVIIKSTTVMNNSLALSSGADDSTSGGGSSGSEISTERSNEVPTSSGNPLTNPVLRSPAKKTKSISNSKLLIQLNKEGSPLKLRSGVNANSAQKRKEEVRDFKHSLCYRALEQAVLIGEDIIDREEEIEVSEGVGLKKIELDSEQGASNCRNFLICIERLYEIL
jgi:hypothetical protein